MAQRCKKSAALSKGFKIAMPVTPVGKARARVTRFGAFTPKATKDFEANVRAHLRIARAPMIDGALVVDMLCVFPRPKGKAAQMRQFHMVKPDADNVCKSILDAGNGILWADDSQVMSLRVTKAYGEPQVILAVRQATLEDLSVVVGWQG